MSKRRLYFHISLLVAAVVIGVLSLWYSGFWMEGKNWVPNFTAIAMVLLVISQGGMLLSLQKQGEK
jgi:CHASE2 domain-containing sensor protein